jgi:hypothetical protein
LKSAPHRDDDFLCGGLETEHAVGDAIERVLSAEWSSQEEDLPRLAQGLFDNEDPWIAANQALPEGWTVAGISAEDPIKQSKSVRREQSLD